MTIDSKNYERNIIYPDFALNIQTPQVVSCLAPDKQANEFDCCDEPEIIENRGLYVCKNCGVDYGPILKDYVSYDLKNETPKNIINNIIVPFQYGSRTIIKCGNLPSSKKLKFQRLAKLNQNFFSSYEHNMTIAYRYLFLITSQLQIPLSITHLAFQLYVKVLKKGLTVGRNIKYLTLSCLFIICRSHKYSCSLKDISEVSQISEKILRKNYRLILQEFPIKLNNHPASYYLIQFCIDLGLSIQFQEIALDLLKSFLSIVNNHTLSPKALAIASIYVTTKNYISEKRVTQQFLSKIAKISEITIRKYLRIFKISLNLPKTRSITRERG